MRRFEPPQGHPARQGKPLIHYLAFHYGDQVHHHSHSGYQRLPQFIQTPWRLTASGPAVIHRWTAAAERFDAWRRLRKPFLALGLIPGGWNLNLDREGLRAPEPIVHYLYGEQVYFLGGLRHRPGAVVTLHEVPTWVDRNLPRRWPKYLKNAARIIAMSSSQAAFLRSRAPEAAVEVVLHGIDTDYFAPVAAAREDFLLFTGGYLRDFKTFLAAMELLLARRKDIRVVAVSPRKSVRQHEAAFHRLTERYSAHRFRLLSGIPDAQLLDLYQKARLYVSPLIDCTANNGLLEAMSCGLPAVVSDVGGVRDYALGDFVQPGNAPALADAVERLWNDEAALRRLGKAHRDRCVDLLDWRLVAPKMERLYADVLEQTPGGRR
ncbi:MAG: hypothetical protein QOC71_1991 [Thermoplasmata archaeon]|nr:hypothetical protein [Thermoplasmata archaeon]